MPVWLPEPSGSAYSRATPCGWPAVGIPRAGAGRRRPPARGGLRRPAPARGLKSPLAAESVALWSEHIMGGPCSHLRLSDTCLLRQRPQCTHELVQRLWRFPDIDHTPATLNGAGYVEKVAFRAFAAQVEHLSHLVILRGSAARKIL